MPASDSSSAIGENIWDLVHRRLSHLNSDYINLLKEASISLSFSKRLVTARDRLYESYLAGQMKDQYNKSTAVRESRRIRRLHADISGILLLSVRSYRYFLLIIDDATRQAWVRLTRTKETSEVLLILQLLKKTIEKEIRDQIVYQRANNGKGEFD